MDNWLQKRVLLTPNKEALVYESESWTFNELNHEVLKVCNKLISLDLNKKTRIAVLGSNSDRLYFLVLALQQLGVQILFINKNLSTEEIDYQLENANTNSIIYEEQFKDKIFKLPKKVKNPLSFNTLFSQPVNNKLRTKNFIVKQFIPEKVTSIMYTSGTTGKPKAVMQTFLNHWSSAIGADLNLPVTFNDIWACAVPIYHISGFSIMMRSLIYGMTVHLYNHFDPVIINKDLENNRSTIVSVVPYMLKKLLSFKNSPYGKSFSYMLLGGGAIDLRTLNLCKKERIKVIQSYGMTETSSQVLALNFDSAFKKIGSVGKPLFPVSLKIKKSNGKNVGEILLKADNIFAGYLNDLESYKDRFTKDGWFKTGDIGYADSEGFIYIKSRLSELIISGGENIYPKEVEDAINLFPGVKESGVVGKKDSKWGNVPIAFLVTNKNINIDKLKSFLCKHLAKFKVPKTFIFIKKLPKTSNGKLKRLDLVKYKLNNK